MTNLDDVRKHIKHNAQVDMVIASIVSEAKDKIVTLEKTKFHIDEVDNRRIALCDWFRTSKYYTKHMTDEEIIERHEKLNEEYEEALCTKKN